MIKKIWKAHPPESPLNGGMNSTIPLLGGVPLYGGEGAFNPSSWALAFRGREDLIFKLLYFLNSRHPQITQSKK